MKLLTAYLRARLRVIVVFAAALGIFYAVPRLYGVQREPLLYAAGLVLFIGLAAAAIGFLRYKKRHGQLALFDPENAPAEQLRELPPPADTIEADHRRIIGELAERIARTEAEGEQREKAVSEYYTMWAHQVKTPVAAMKLLIQEDESELSRDLTPELLRVEQYIDMALNYTRLGSTGDLVIRPYSLYEVVKQSVKKFAPMFIKKRLTLELEPFDDTVLTDEKWLGFAVEQILSNAVKYTPKGGAITIDTERGGDKLLLRIRDTGIGVSAEDLPRIFEMSYTGLNGRKEKSSTGVGLYLTKRALDMLGHGISVASRMGEGTTVTIEFEDAAPDIRD